MVSGKAVEEKASQIEMEMKIYEEKEIKKARGGGVAGGDTTKNSTAQFFKIWWIFLRKGGECRVWWCIFILGNLLRVEFTWLYSSW